MGHTHRIPLNLGNEAPNEESLKSILEADGILAAGGPGSHVDTFR